MPFSQQSLIRFCRYLRSVFTVGGVGSWISIKDPWSLKSLFFRVCLSPLPCFQGTLFFRIPLFCCIRLVGDPVAYDFNSDTFILSSVCRQTPLHLEFSVAEESCFLWCSEQKGCVRMYRKRDGTCEARALVSASSEKMGCLFPRSGGASAV